MSLFNKKTSVLLPIALLFTTLLFAVSLTFIPIQDSLNEAFFQTSDSFSDDSIPAGKSQDSVFNHSIQLADIFFNEKKYEQCLTELEKASRLKPGDQTVKDRINKVKDLLANRDLQQEACKKSIASGDSYSAARDFLNAKSSYQLAVNQNPDNPEAKEKLKKTVELLRSQKAQNILYDVAIASADKLFQAGEYTRAQTEYEKASSILPAETYPKKKINEIIKILVDLQSKEDEYARAISSADKKYQLMIYQDALNEYKKAGKLKPEEKYPQDRIRELTEIIDKQKLLDETYARAISTGDRLFTELNYPESKKSYQEALSVKPAELYPANRIKEIERIQLDQEKTKQTYEKLITLADSLYITKEYGKARESYQNAIYVKPTENYPKEMISKVESMMTGLEASLARQKSLDDQYQSKIRSADGMFTEKNYDKAREEYRGALTLKPSETYPKERIAEVDRILAEQAARRTLEENYTTAVTRADQYLAAGSYDQAHSEYTRAAELKPEEAYPRRKITEIEGIVKELARRKEIDEQYKTAVASGDKLFNDKSYEQALTEYRKALDLKPQEQYPKDRIAASDKELAELSRKKALEDQYTGSIQSADRLMGEKRWEEARAEYEKAATIKPAERYPKDKIAEIATVLAELARQKSLDDQYQSKIRSADGMFTEKNYDKAREEYRGALTLKPSETYPKERIAEVDRILAEQAARRTLEENYTTAVTRADQYLAAGSYDQARSEYTRAAELKPEEAYPREKITEIEGIVKELARRKEIDEQYKAAVASGDKLFSDKSYEQALTEYRKALDLKPQEQYPKDRIAMVEKAVEELIGKQKVFDNLLAEGEILLKDRDYSKARETFQKASRMFPENPLPKERLNLINSRIDSLYRANKSLYDKAIADGDRYYNSYEFDKAIDAFTDAMNFLPMESYPREMINKIKRTIAENAISDVLNTPVIIKADNTRQFSFSPVNIASRKNNFVYIRIRNLSNKPFNVLMKYGKDKQPNGGVVIRNIPANEKINERLISVRDQDLWSREDNNWISLYPQGGDIEVSFIQVSRAK